MSYHVDIPVTQMAQFSAFIADQVGLHFPQDRWQDLMRGINSAARDSGATDAQSYIDQLMSRSLSKREVEMLASHLTVGETYFFRDEKSFAALEEHVLPELIRLRRDGEKYLRIWSAGCCTGEEPYSIMMLLDRLLPDLDDWRITLLATDINPRFLDRAASGIYGEWSFRATPLIMREQFFTKTAEGRFKIDPRIRKLVTFAYLNLAVDVYPSLLNNTNGMDIILCRNVLMYFSPKRAQKVFYKLHRCLVEGGWLIVSPIEAPQGLSSEFAREHYSGVFFYRKDSNRRNITDAPITGRQTEKLETSYLPPHVSKMDEAFQWVPAVDSENQPANDITYRETAESPPDSLEQTRVLYGQGFYEEAAEVKCSDNIEAMLLLARTLANSGKLTDALAWCQKVVAADKLNPASHYLFAVILQEQGQVTDAVASLKRALYLDPDFALACFTLGNLARRQGRRKESERHYQHALTILDGYPLDASLPEAEGMTAGRLREIIRLAIDKEMAI